jgi:ATP-dependent Lhr-like helicase
VLYLERGGRGLQTLAPADGPEVERALAALVAFVRAGHGSLRRLALEKVDGEPALSSPIAAQLVACGFQEGPRRLTLSA